MRDRRGLWEDRRGLWEVLRALIRLHLGGCEGKTILAVLRGIETSIGQRPKGGNLANKAAEVLVGTLAASGVKRIYGLPGDSLNGLTDAIRTQGEIQWVHVRH